MKRTTLETTFDDAICTETADPLQPITCQCGTTSALDGGSRLRYGSFFGQTIVAGCHCDGASRFGGVLWGSRHAAAAFLRGMSDALEADRLRLLDALPREVVLVDTFGQLSTSTKRSADPVPLPFPGADKLADDKSRTNE